MTIHFYQKVKNKDIGQMFLQETKFLVCFTFEDFLFSHKNELTNQGVPCLVLSTYHIPK